MQKLVFASWITAAMAAVVLGFAAPAQADLGHEIWVNTITNPHVYVPHVDTTPHH